MTNQNEQQQQTENVEIAKDTVQELTQALNQHQAKKNEQQVQQQQNNQ